jgi:hypothetical protein
MSLSNRQIEINGLKKKAGVTKARKIQRNRKIRRSNKLEKPDMKYNGY